jgi:phospholipid-binding lipoprotein MlaA
VTLRRARTVALLIALLAVPARAEDGIAPALTASFAREAAALGSVARTGRSADPSGAEQTNAETRMAALAIAAIAEDPARHGAIVAAATAAAPGLANGIRARAAAAFPGFAQDFVAAPPRATTTQPATEVSDDVDDEGADDVAFVASDAGATEAMHDPLEGLNRFVFALNDAVDTLVLRPAAALYGFVTPLVVKQAVTRFYDNLKSPVILANDLLQGNVTDGAAVTLGRFVVNSTAGLVGLLDVATGLGLPGHDADFGQTLYMYGLGPGPYVVLPLLGPSTMRDATGQVVDSFLDPLGYVLPFEASLGLTAGEAISKREEIMDPLDQLRLGSLDYYAAVRGAYYQHRADELGVAGDAPATPAADEAFESFE